MNPGRRRAAAAAARPLRSVRRRHRADATSTIAPRCCGAASRSIAPGARSHVRRRRRRALAARCAAARTGRDSRRRGRQPRLASRSRSAPKACAPTSRCAGPRRRYAGLERPAPSRRRRSVAASRRWCSAHRARRGTVRSADAAARRTRTAPCPTALDELDHDPRSRSTPDDGPASCAGTAERPRCRSARERDAADPRARPNDDLGARSHRSATVPAGDAPGAPIARTRHRPRPRTPASRRPDGTRHATRSARRGPARGRVGRLVILAVDLSGSMGAPRRGRGRERHACSAC